MQRRHRWRVLSPRAVPLLSVTVADALAGLTGPVFTGPVSGQSEVFTERPTFPE
jgi:hypothetical protein